jgi:hypothetical protein
MHDPKLYRLLRDSDRNKREQALISLIEGDYMETIERLCKGITLLEPGTRSTRNHKLDAYTIELSKGCEAYWRLHDDIRDIAVRLALFKTGRLGQDSKHKLLGNDDGILSADEAWEKQWEKEWLSRGFQPLLAVGHLAGLRHFGPLHEKVETYKFISINGLPDLSSLEFGGILPNLEEIRIQDCAGLENLDGLAALTSLKRIWLRNLPSLINVTALARLETLEEIRISDCPMLDSIECLSELDALETAYFENCENLALAPNHWPDRIKTLVLEKVAIKSLGVLPKSLKQVLRVRDSRNLKTLDGLEACTVLTEVVVSQTIRDCSALESLEKAWLNLELDCLDRKYGAHAMIPEEVIEALVALENLRLKLTCADSPHFNLLNPEAITRLTRLKSLDLSSCFFSGSSIFLSLNQLEFLKVQPRSEMSKLLGGCTLEKSEIEAMRLRLLAS